MAMTDLSPRSATDLQGLQRLKKSARAEGTQAQAQALREASRQFEALFLQMMLKSMRDATPKTGLFDNSQSDMYSEMLDQQWAQQLAGNGTGLSEQLALQLQQHLQQSQGVAEAANLAKKVAGASSGSSFDVLAALPPRATPRLLSNNQPVDRSVALLDAQMSRSSAATAGFSVPALRAARAYGAGNARPLVTDNAERPEYVQRFLQKFTAPARAASAMSGVPTELILAQAALETGWGRSEIPTNNGGNSYNLFGIKANAQWQGKTTDATTTEFVDGVVQSRVESFRVYPSYHAAFADYARLISNNPRYSGVVSATTPAQAAQALQRGGYATDPNYAAKLVAVMNSMGSLDGSGELAQQQANGVNRGALLAREDLLNK